MTVIWYWILVGTAIKASIVLSLAWLVAVLLRRRSAAARHLVWTAAAAAVLALPLFTIGLPALQLPAMTGILRSSPTVVFSSTASQARPAAVPYAWSDTRAVAPTKKPAGRVNWQLWLMLLWLVGAAAAFARMLAASAAIWSIRRCARASSESGLSSALSRQLGVRQQVEVLETPSGNMPMTCGILRPFILIPANSAEWTEERRRVVLLHELAHVWRGDVATHLLARTALCVYWWNPLAWMAWHSFIQERERAADDLVLTAGARASEYAGHLLEIARGMQSSPALEYAAVAMVRPSQLEERLRAILDASINRNTPGRAGAVLVMIVMLALVAPLAAVRAQEPQMSQAQAMTADVDALIRSAIVQKSPEILENAARAAEGLRRYEIAQKLRQSAVAIRGEVSGQESVEYGAGLLNLADLEQRWHFKSAEASYAKAAHVLGDRPEAARAYIHFGITALSKMDFLLAIENFEHARRIDSSRAGSALMWMALVRQRESNPDEAAALYLSALSEQDPNSPEASTTRKVYAQFLRDQGRADEAADVEKTNVAKVRRESGVSAGVYRAGSAGVTFPSLLHRVEPEYSDDARAARLTGTEVLYVEIGPDGRAHNPFVVRGLGLGLDENGIDAVSQWQFQPGTKDGQPV
ncbi:MAG: energy transducer TonB, partial [Acidobacteriota bacterium]|nr:energy transducer TonB [Acidobacteriota bacterium]